MEETRRLRFYVVWSLDEFGRPGMELYEGEELGARGCGFDMAFVEKLENREVNIFVDHNCAFALTGRKFKLLLDNVLVLCSLKYTLAIS